jgi:hypothetical protein
VSQEKLSSQDLCQLLMQEVSKAIYGSAKRQVNYLRNGTETLLDKELGKHILNLSSLQLTEQQLNALEASFRQVQEELIGWLFSLIDGNTRPPGWPDTIRLVNMDTNEIICPENLEWAFAVVMGEYEDQLKGNT